MTAPKRRYESSPSPLRRISPGEPPGTGKRHPSKPLVSFRDHHGAPTLVMLTVGGPSQMTTQLVQKWLDHATEARVNFCAIQAGAAPRSDGLEELLRANVPRNTRLYVVQRDVGATGELQDLTEMLSDLKIPLARTQPLIANAHSDQNFLPGAEYAEDGATPVNPLPKSMETGLSFADRRKVIAEPLFQAMADAIALGEQQELARGAVAELQNVIKWMGGDLTPSTQMCLVAAFNRLQSARHWRWDAGPEGLHGTIGANTLRQILQDLSIDHVAQQKLADPLCLLFDAMGEDQAACQAVLDAAADLPPYARSVNAVLRLHTAYIEHWLGSRAPDRATALECARRVFMCEEVRKIYDHEMEALRHAPQYHASSENRFHSAFEDALIHVLFGSTEVQSLEERERNVDDPIANVAWNACRAIEQITMESEDFLSFLDDWPAWQAWLRDETEDTGEAESQQPPK